MTFERIIALELDGILWLIAYTRCHLRFSKLSEFYLDYLRQ